MRDCIIVSTQESAEVARALEGTTMPIDDREKLMEFLAEMDRPDAMRRELEHAITATERAYARTTSPQLKDYLKAQLRDFRAELAGMGETPHA